MNNLQEIIRKQIVNPLLERKSIAQLYKATPAKIKQRAKSDISVKLKTISNKGKWAFKTTTGSNGHTWNPYIIPVLPKTDKSGRIFNLNPNIRSSVIVWCNCPHFKYTLEYSLHKNDASRIVNSNGSAAVITNPDNKAYLCKHLQACAVDYLERIKDKK